MVLKIPFGDFYLSNDYARLPEGLEKFLQTTAQSGANPNQITISPRRPKVQKLTPDLSSSKGVSPNSFRPIHEPFCSLGEDLLAVELDLPQIGWFFYTFATSTDFVQVRVNTRHFTITDVNERETLNESYSAFV